MIQLKSTIVRFANHITPREIDFFRGAIIEAASMGGSVLFHNHTADGFRYKYPLIQYKILDGCAAVVGVGDGTDALHALLPFLEKNMNIGYKELPFRVMSVDDVVTNVDITDHMLRYVLTDWMPLNQENVRLFHSTKDRRLRRQMLERILEGNIATLFDGIDYSTDKKYYCHIDEQGDIHNEMYKGVQMKTMDVAFSCNVILPAKLGLGKGSSHGHGTIHLN